jgi:hypothetical protein
VAERVLLQRSNDRGSRLRRGVPGLLEEGGMIRVRSLSEGVEPVREWFNDKSAFARLIAIQSAT